MTQKKTKRPTYGAFAPFCAAQMGVDLIGLFQLAGLSGFDKRLTVAAICFAASLPILTLFLLNQMFESMARSGTEIWYQDSAFTVGTIGTLGGLSALIFHLSMIAGYAFVVLVIVGFFLHYHYVKLVEKGRDES